MSDNLADINIKKFLVDYFNGSEENQKKTLFNLLIKLSNLEHYRDDIDHSILRLRQINIINQVCIWNGYIS